VSELERMRRDSAELDALLTELGVPWMATPAERVRYMAFVTDCLASAVRPDTMGVMGG
jgi:hypothetical protein